ncbi:MAG: hypothetical protein CENE_00197 [Candidatus Celerinatantimonas neptuna]|nr:MAG: hypothetical protein CENE_00197 [Candidatus Celerinatantimonas neptuna]
MDILYLKYIEYIGVYIMKAFSLRRKYLLGVGLSCMSLAAIGATTSSSHLLSSPIVTTSQSSKISQNLQEALNQQQNLSNVLSGKKIIANLQLKNIPSNLKQQLSSLGVNVLSISKDYNQAAVAVTRHSNVKSLIKLPVLLHASLVSGEGSGTGKAFNRGYNSIGMDRLAKLMPNLTGKGIRIGIISGSFSHTSGVRGSDTTPAKCKAGILENAKDQLTGDLPAKVDIQGDSCSSSYSGEDEGAAMAEVIHDIAPGAAISFHSAAPTSQETFVNSLNDLCKSKANGGPGVDIIVDDAFYFGEPYYQEGITNQAIQNCIKKGVMYFTIAGNDADRDYQFKYKDINPSIRDAHSATGTKITYGDDFQEWPNGSAFLPITIPANSKFRADLTWNQPYISFQKNKVNFPLIDFDLFLFRKNSNGKMSQITYSDNHQGKGYYNDPYEQVGYNNTSSSTVTVYLAVNHWSGNTDFIPQDKNVPVLLDLRFPEPTSDDIKVGGGVTFNAPVMNGHAWTKGAITVGSMPWNWSIYDVAQNKTKPETESSKGALTHQFYFNVNGDLDLSTRSGPTLAAPDGGDTTFFGKDDPSSWDIYGEPDGYPNYYGTSAAAPVAAALAAVLKQYAGKDVSNSLIRKALVSTAHDVYSGRASKGWDPVTGAGEVDAVAAFKYLKKELGKQ